MSDSHQFTSVTFRNYKALKKYSISLSSFNILVGPNNAGKSTIIGAFRILAEGMRKALVKKPEYIDIPGEEAWGYRVPLEDLPIASENIFSDYDDSQPAVVEFHLSSGNKLALIFPETNLCYLVCKTKHKAVKSPSDFQREYQASVGFVPVLGPVEHDEPLYQKDAARRALLTHSASRNFRNIWYHYPEDFDEFREMIRSSWPGMDIEKPEIQYTKENISMTTLYLSSQNPPLSPFSKGGLAFPPLWQRGVRGDFENLCLLTNELLSSSEKRTLHMFCPEERFSRELYWAGFGFQVWCQMLTIMDHNFKTE